MVAALGPHAKLLWLWTIVDGQFSDDLVPDDDAEDELGNYDAGRYSHQGETLRVQRTDPDEREAPERRVLRQVGAVLRRTEVLESGCAPLPQGFVPPGAVRRNKKR